MTTFSDTNLIGEPTKQTPFEPLTATSDSSQDVETQILTWVGHMNSPRAQFQDLGRIVIP